MKLAIVHISDLHFRKDRTKNPVLSRTDKIAGALRGLSEPNLDACFVTVTGDIAFSGHSAEYLLALEFFNQLTIDLQEFDVSSANLLFIPGNHDCDFSQENRIREAMIRDTIRTTDHLNSIDTSIVDKCLESQNQYRDFASLFSKDPENYEATLYTSQKYQINERLIMFQCYNTAWMSELEEKQGQLYFPTHLLPNPREDESDLIVAMLHHPFRWFESNNARTFSRLVEESSDLILTGHEHTQDRYQKVRFDGSSSQFIEGSVMQNAHQVTSGFSVILVDLISQQQKHAEFSWSGSFYKPKDDPDWTPFNRARRSTTISHTSSFSNYLHDMGTRFTHPKKDTIVLDDLFVFPDLRSVASGTRRSKTTPHTDEAVSSESLLNRPVSRALIIGPIGSGKSTLSRALCLKFQRKGMKPLLLRGGELKRGHNEEFLKSVIKTAIKEQYGNDHLDLYLQLSIDQKIAIVDDIHACNINQAGYASLIENLQSRFASLLVFADDSFFLSRVAQTKHETNGFIGFSIFSLREMGNKLRGALIDRWTDLGQDYRDSSRDEALQIEALESKVRTLLGKNLMPSYPIFVLAILQTYESQKALNTASGSYGYYYEALITAALHDQRSAVPHDTVYAFLSMLAFEMFDKKMLKLSAAKFRALVAEYCARHQVNLNEDDIRRLLQRAHIVTWDEFDSGSFQYHYVYYYFVAKYFADNIYRAAHSASVRATIVRLVENLHVEEYANIVIFFLYLTKDEGSIRKLVERATLLYADAVPCDFDSAVRFTETLTIVRPQMLLEDGDSRSHKQQHREELDRSDAASETGDLQDGEDQVEGIIRLNEAFKTLQVMGQVLRNFPGSLEGDTKVEIARESYLLGLRIFGFVCGMFESNLSEFRVVFKSVLEDEGDGDIESKKLDDAVDFAIYRILSAVGFGMIKKISQCVGSEYLKETLEEVSDDDVPLSISLINVSMKLDHFRQFPNDEIVHIYDVVRGNKFTSEIVQKLVVQHLYLFPLPQAIRQEVCDKIGIQILDPKLITGEDHK